MLKLKEITKEGRKNTKNWSHYVMLKGLKVQEPTQEDALYLLPKFHTIVFFSWRI
jgi:hypothetical protein